VRERRADSTLIDIALGTGRRHQIRVQLAAIGHPVVGDARHGSRRDPLGRICLHATILGFVHPGSGAGVRFESPVPAAFARVGRGV
jgi:23S rRNA pseudouridine1911/1915/1917 synthase